MAWASTIPDRKFFIGYALLTIACVETLQEKSDKMT